MDKKDSEHRVRLQLLPRDRFTTLPVEILSEIFRVAYTPASLPTGPICRALLPFDRSTRFRRLQVKSGGKLRKLAELVEEGKSAPALKNRQLKSFFANLPHLSRLELGKGCQLSLRLILSNSLARASLRNLSHLAIEAVEGKNPFDPTLYSLLNSYPALRSLSITSDISWDNLQLIKLPKKKVEPLSGLVELIVTSEGADLPIVSFLIQACPRLQFLSLSVTSCPSDFHNLLPLLPVGLKRLELKTLPADPTDPNRPCDNLLSRFTDLEHLYLGDGTFHPNILDLVRTFPRLTSLGFGKDALNRSKDLLSLITGPTRMVHLQTLTLDNVEGKVGWRIWEDGDGFLHPDADEGEFHLGPGWTLPCFTFTFDEADLPDVVAQAELNGIERYAMETGDFTQLRAEIGDELVEEFKDEIGWNYGCECGECW